jgi:hypothetical protein
MDRDGYRRCSLRARGEALIEESIAPVTSGRFDKPGGHFDKPAGAISTRDLREIVTKLAGKTSLGQSACRLEAKGGDSREFRPEARRGRGIRLALERSAP